ncbi:MAG TPA: hypothetical protein VI078_14795 [bacterium]
MKNQKHRLEAAARRVMIPALAASLLLSASCSPALSAPGPGIADGNTQPDALAAITVSFKLDFRMNGPSYGGERWVSPPTFTFAQGGRELTLEARAQGVDAQGRPLDIRPTWIPSDPAMVTVTPGQGNEVRITVRSPGQSSLDVTSQGISRHLAITAVTHGGEGIRVDISQ